MSEAPIRIAYLSIGRHIHTERWLRFFAAKGYEIHLLTVQPGPIEGVTVHDITSASGPKPLRYWTSLGRVKRLLAEIRPDILHTHFLTGYGYWGVFSGYRPFLLTVWGDDVYTTPHETPLKSWLARRALSRADWVSGDSRDIVEAAIRLGARRERSEVMQWGVDFTRFHPGVATRARADLETAPGVPVVLSTRSFTQPYYNIDLIVDSIPAVLARRPDTIFWIAGYEGSDAAMRERVERLGVTRWVRFLGRIPHEKLPAVLEAADVFLTVPSVDATAVSLLEAMAMGKAIVASSLPSAMEWIVEGESGAVVPPREGEPLVEKILFLLDRPDHRKRLGARAVEIVRARADHAKHMERMDEVYREFARGKREGKFA